jgi:hypothetical protein
LFCSPPHPCAAFPGLPRLHKTPSAQQFKTGLFQD